MSDLHTRVSALYRAGYDGSPAPALFEDWSAVKVEQFRPAAVLVAMTEREEPGMILLHRPSNMRAHPGQIAFPGGKVDPGESAEEAALREAWEELAIPPEKVRIIGKGDIYRAHSGFEITPVLATVPPDLEIIPNPTEVAQWFEPPVAHMLDPANHAEKWAEWEGGMRPYYEILWREHNTWGVTAAIIVNMAKRLGWHG
ncbi:CoA pyrophosphatase [Novosphingobium sp. MW5]|nr:CoA pyrophosphatase [Novosphingobium sp. MW5]